MLFFFLLVLPALACARRPKTVEHSGTGFAEPKRIGIVIGSDTIRAEVAATEPARALGLMYRMGMPENEGMLFIFDSAGIYPFWMRNTRIALSIAFMDSGRRIVDIEDMAPFDDVTLHPPSKPALYALELNQGWFERHGVQPGAKVEFLESVPGSAADERR